MADFENSRILPTVTRGTLFSVVIVPATCMITTPALGMASQMPTRPLDDFAVHASRKRNAAHTRYLDLGRLRSEVERITTGDIKIPLDDVFFLSISEEFDKYLKGNPRRAKAHRQTLADLTELSSAWDEADDRIGYTRVAEAKSKACEQRSTLAASALTSCARSVARVAAKLRCFIEMSIPIFPWARLVHPALRTVIEEPSFSSLRSIPVDLVQLGEAGNV
ncbi:hypothetical protein [Rhizobium sp.]|uniref:hypothetical protein n=1 Tax=Rhizobium sp. TaxID=391 RepID=UPI0028AE31DE